MTKSFLSLSSSLRRLQNEFGTAEELHHARVHSLAESKKKFEKLQVEAKMFEEKKELEKKIKLLEKMRHWIAAEEQRKVVQVSVELRVVCTFILVPIALLATQVVLRQGCAGLRQGEREHGAPAPGARSHRR